jgi:hypothetical protein
MKPDKEWFLSRIKDSPYGSVRQFAKAINGEHGSIDHTMISKILSGDRSISLWEAMQFAELLGVSLDEIAKRIYPKKPKR